MTSIALGVAAAVCLFGAWQVPRLRAYLVGAGVGLVLAAVALFRKRPPPVPADVLSTEADAARDEADKARRAPQTMNADEVAAGLSRHARAIAFALSLAIASNATAQPAVSMAGPNGEAGVWVELTLARDALGCLDAREPTERRIRLLEAELQIARRHRPVWGWIALGLVLGIGSTAAMFAAVR